jgi:hypothetical protein
VARRREAWRRGGGDAGGAGALLARAGEALATRAEEALATGAATAAADDGGRGFWQPAGVLESSLHAERRSPGRWNQPGKKICFYTLAPLVPVHGSNRD